MEEDKYKAEFKNVRVKKRKMTTKLKGFMSQDASIMESSTFDSLMKSIDEACYEVTDNVDELIIQLEDLEMEQENNEKIANLEEISKEVLQILKDSKNELMERRAKTSTALIKQEANQKLKGKDEDGTDETDNPGEELSVRQTVSVTYNAAQEKTKSSNQNFLQTLIEKTKKAVNTESSKEGNEHPSKQCAHCSKPILSEYAENKEGLFHPRCSPLQRKITGKNCYICKKVLLGSSSILADANGNCYHPSCSKCKACQTPIKGPVAEDPNGFLFHPDCRRCEGCGALFTGEFPCSSEGKCKISSGEKCNKCRGTLGRRYTKTEDGNSFHIECIRCSMCGDILRGSYGIFEGEPICQADLMKCRKKCMHCSEPILSEYVENTEGVFHPSCSPMQRDIKDKKCKFCKKTLLGETSVSNDSSGYYHPACFTCAICKNPIEKGFIRKENGQVVHSECPRSTIYVPSSIQQKISENKPNKIQSNGRNAGMSLESLKQNESLLGVTKQHVSDNLEDYLNIIMKEGSKERRIITEHLKMGIKKLSEGFFEKAKDEFQKASDTENNQFDDEGALIGRCRLFAKVMVISYAEENEQHGPCFRTLDHLTEEEKKEIIMEIDHVLDKNIDNNHMKQVTFGIRANCKDSKIFLDESKIEVAIDFSGLPSKEVSAALLHIKESGREDHLFLWSDVSSIFIRKRLKVFCIPLSQLDTRNEKRLSFRLEKREEGLVCHFGKQFDHRATCVQRSLKNFHSIDKLMKWIKAPGSEDKTLTTLEQIVATPDILLLDTGVDINKKDTEGNTLLHNTSSCILQTGRSLKWQDRLRPLVRAAPSPVHLLIEAGACLSATNKDGLTPLMLALKDIKKNKGKIKVLIHYSKPVEINATDKNGCTVLHHLAKNKMQAPPAFLENTTKALLKHEIDVTAADKDGFNARDLAREYGNNTVTEILSNFLSGN